MAEIIDDLHEELEQEDEIVPQPEPEVEDTIPEKFKGKTAQEIADSYVNLEREFGRKAQEVGELRQLTDKILQQQIETTKPKEEPEQEDTDFFVDPKTAINKAVENHPKIKQFEEQARLSIQQQQAFKAKQSEEAFKQKHGDFQEILQEKDFQTWVSSSPIRQQLFQQANANYDFYAGDELFSTYKELKKVKQANEVKQADETKAILKAASVPTGVASSESSTKVYRRADLIRLKMTDPNRYEAMGDEILKAYSEGRVK
ncbi:MAG: hypothetical protein RBT52_06325 [Sulfurimonas sp.]|jgi:hypothetical protein|nr:hypothetical protein [Sulfurimonas sp.]